jgi:hypothetical protein
LLLLEVVVVVGSFECGFDKAWTIFFLKNYYLNGFFFENYNKFCYASKMNKKLFVLNINKKKNSECDLVLWYKLKLNSKNNKHFFFVWFLSWFIIVVV